MNERIKFVIRLLEQLGFDELRAIELLLVRIVAGRSEYGDLDIPHDRRNFLAQAAEEALDGSFYLAVQLVRLKDSPAAQPPRVVDTPPDGTPQP